MISIFEFGFLFIWWFSFLSPRIIPRRICNFQFLFSLTSSIISLLYTEDIISFVQIRRTVNIIMPIPSAGFSWLSSHGHFPVYLKRSLFQWPLRIGFCIIIVIIILRFILSKRLIDSSSQLPSISDRTTCWYLFPRYDLRIYKGVQMLARRC